jgi:cysteine desulfurase / selenocysteine lyase
MDLELLRSRFPVTRRLAYLNHAAQSPLNSPVRERLEAYLDLAAENPDQRPGSRAAVRILLARLLGGAPQEYALVTSTGIGIGIVAAGLSWRPGDNVVLPAGEHWNNTYPWLALRERGVELRFVPARPGGGFDPERLEERVDGRTRVVALAAVNHLSGFRADLGRISRTAHAHGALLVVDGIQGAGVVPLDVVAQGIDVLAGAGFKWLLGMHGTGFLYVSREALDRLRPVLPGMFSAEDLPDELRLWPDARRFETGTLAYGLFHAWTAGLELLLDLGVTSIHARVMMLTDRLISGLRTKAVSLLTPLDDPAGRSAIVSFTVGSEEANQGLQARLEAAGVVISVRRGNCRVSPSFFNTEEEIDRLLQAL